MFFLNMSNARPMNLILTSSSSSYAAFTLNKDVNLYVSFPLTYPAVIGPQPSCFDPEPVFQHVRQFAESCFYYLHSKTGNRN